MSSPQQHIFMYSLFCSPAIPSSLKLCRQCAVLHLCGKIQEFSKTQSLISKVKSSAMSGFVRVNLCFPFQFEILLRNFSGPVRSCPSGVSENFSSLKYFTSVLVYNFLVYLNPVSLSSCARLYCHPIKQSSVYSSGFPFVVSLFRFSTAEFASPLNCTFVIQLDFLVSTYFQNKMVLIENLPASLSIIESS